MLWVAWASQSSTFRLSGQLLWFEESGASARGQHACEIACTLANEKQLVQFRSSSSIHCVDGSYPYQLIRRSPWLHSIQHHFLTIKIAVSAQNDEAYWHDGLGFLCFDSRKLFLVVYLGALSVCNVLRMRSVTQAWTQVITQQRIISVVKVAMNNIIIGCQGLIIDLLWKPVQPVFCVLY